YHVNLAQRFSAQYEGSEWQAFFRLNAANLEPFSAFLRLPEQAILTLSPERVIRLHNGAIETLPIKGTLPRLSDPEEDARQALRLAQTPKDRAENLMIVALLRNDLGRVATPG
ncbi:chorismate-binding protein, partial [Leptospira borgpetersenii serovar Ballum]|nr:chorismate-binding protein [Leptospira borgpetersenii serovar Ballum]